MEFDEIIIPAFVPTTLDPDPTYEPPTETDDPLQETLDWFRDLAREFSERTDGYVMRWIKGTLPLVGAEYFRDMYTQALALRTAHRIKMAQIAQDNADGIFPVKSISEDGGSTSFGLVQAGATDESLLKTKYGQMFIEIRDSLYVGLIV